MARVATHVTEADIASKHISLAKECGMEAVGFKHGSCKKLVEQAKLMESYGV